MLASITVVWISAGFLLINMGYFHNDSRYVTRYDKVMNKSVVLYDRTDAYFSHQEAPLRAVSLMTSPVVVIVLGDPIMKAYDVYQVRI